MDFYTLLNNAFYEKTKENVRSTVKIKNIAKDDDKKIFTKT